MKTLQDQLQLRAHDLPPRWDGLAVVWRGWEPSRDGVVFICPPPKLPPACEGCGSLAWAAAPTNRGMVGRLPEVTHEHLDRYMDRIRGQHPLASIDPQPGWYRLVVTRCPDCALDLVWDIDADQWWTLDLTDYGDDGSVEPSSPVANREPLDPAAARASAIAAARAAIAKPDGTTQGTLL